ncbi:MAG: putative molybdenum carrier protein [Bacteroidales bacterium]|jgi:hypothetical protein|nr:putative molybdenum carrier protein [Bacteroidales bacterium]
MIKRDPKLKLISGGQSGTDRATLDFALKNNFPCGGWCPLGRKAEDGIIPGHYPLKETKTSDYDERTLLNVKDSDGTLMILLGEMDEGTRLTLKFAQEHGKPVFMVNDSDPADAIGFRNWITDNNIRILNVAGPRESSAKGIYAFTLKTLKYLFPL